MEHGVEIKSPGKVHKPCTVKTLSGGTRIKILITHRVTAGKFFCKRSYILCGEVVDVIYCGFALYCISRVCYSWSLQNKSFSQSGFLFPFLLIKQMRDAGPRRDFVRVAPWRRNFLLCLGSCALINSRVCTCR